MDQSKTKNEEPLESRPFSFYALIFLGVLLLASTIAMAWLAGWFPYDCLLYTSPSPRDATLSRMPSSA